MRKNVTHGFEVSRKILCILLTGLLLLQTGCTTTKVLQTVEREELQTVEQKRLHMKLGQQVRITYLKDGKKNTKCQEGWVKSVTSDAILVTCKPKTKNEGEEDISVSFDEIEKIEMIERSVSIKDSVITAFILIIIIYNITDGDLN